MTTVAEIAEKAFTAVAAAITDVIQTATVAKEATDGVFDPDDGEFQPGTDVQTLTGGQAFETTEDVLQDILPEMIVGAKEKVFMVRGLSGTPEENDQLTVTHPRTSAVVTYRIKAVGDIVGAGAVFVMLVV